MMMEFPEALEVVLRHAEALPTCTMPLARCNGHFLAKDLLSPLDHPLFDQSAVDGYALRFEDLAAFPSLETTQEIKAGDESGKPILAGQCRRIFTGAPIPKGADTVVMQEHCEMENGLLKVLDKGLKLGGNVRKQAEQIARGQLALKAGSKLNPAAIGFLASLGFQELEVHRKPVLKVIVTGNEFVMPGEKPREGQIHESNGAMLMAALETMGLEGSYAICKDNLGDLSAKVAELSPLCDVLILTGGVSVGDYDFSPAALANNGVDIVFHKVNQKPGKPLLFGRKEAQLCFGLPGNPRAVMLCFLLYVRPALLAMMGGHAPLSSSIQLPLAHEYRRSPDGKTHFITGKIIGGELNLLGGQQSHMLHSLAEADCLAILPPSPLDLAKGQKLDCQILP